jgi:hypothetical protein
MFSLLKLGGEYSEVRVVYWVQPFAHERVGRIIEEISVNSPTILTLKVEAEQGGQCHNGVYRYYTSPFTLNTLLFGDIRPL